MSLVGESSVLVAAGVLAGAVGTAGGITSLVSYPALLAVGVPPLPANVANLVAIVACWPGSTLTSRRELIGVKPSLARGLPVAACGAAAGAVLLLSTPAGAFSRVVPFLVATGSFALLIQPWLTARFPRQRPQAGAFAWSLIGLVSIYTGYFGAGSGVLLLAVVLVLVDDRLPEANAVKNMLVGAGAVASAAVFVLAGPVDWRAVAPLGAGLFRWQYRRSCRRPPRATDRRAMGRRCARRRPRYRALGASQLTNPKRTRSADDHFATGRHRLRRPTRSESHHLAQPFT